MNIKQAIEFLEKEKGYYTNSSIYMNRVMNNTEKGSSLYKKIKYLELAIKALEEKKKRDEMIVKYKTQSGMVELEDGEWVKFADIKQALEKQIPRKTTADGMCARCPNCWTSYDRFDVEKYCDICGQKLGEE